MMNSWVMAVMGYTSWLYSSNCRLIEFGKPYDEFWMSHGTGMDQLSQHPSDEKDLVSQRYPSSRFPPMKFERNKNSNNNNNNKDDDDDYPWHNHNNNDSKNPSQD